MFVLALAACGRTEPETDAVTWTLPSFEELPEQVDPPDPFVLMETGERVTDGEGWSAQRAPEVRRLFEHYVYGAAPAAVPVAVTERARRDGVLGGLADVVELDLDVGGVPVAVVLYLPANATGPVPVVLGLNKCGNHTLSAEPDVALSASWPDPACGSDATEAGRGSFSEAWSVDDVLARGFAVASFAQSDVDPDDPDPLARAGGVRDRFAPEDGPAWGTLAAWSWGLSRAIDALEARPEVDRERLMLFGHSRRGKAALWCAANDPRVDLVWAHQSGIVGAALERGSTGETVTAITTFFPHWFTPDFARFADHETRLPVDQHLLLALVAPRPVVVIDGEGDGWANPPGATDAVERARPVYELLGAAEGAQGRELRPGEHEVLRTDWQLALAFAFDRGF